MHLVFDLETTGKLNIYGKNVTSLDDYPRVVQIAWQLYDINEQLISEKNYIIKPFGFVIPIESTKIHGIHHSEASLIGVPIRQALTYFIKDLFKAKYLIAHNILFDAIVLSREALDCDLEIDFSNITTICTMQSSTNFCKIPFKSNTIYSNNYKLPKLQELHHILFGYTFKDTHNAISDVKACAKCYFTLKHLNIITQL